MTATSEGIEASVRSAVLATYVVFIASGVAFASWASRIPQVRDRFYLDPSELGLVLLAIAAGSVIALPLSGVVIGHFGSRWTVRTTALLVAVAMTVVSLGYLVGLVPGIRGGFVSVVSMAAGFLGILVAGIKAVKWLF